MSDTLVRALGVEIFQDTADPLQAKQHFKNIAVVADKDILSLCESFFGTATYLHLVIPKQAGDLVIREAYKKAVEFGAFNRGLIYGIAISLDLSGLDSNALDGIVISTENMAVMQDFINHAARVVREAGRIVVVTKATLDDKWFGDYAVAGLRQVENFYCGTVRKMRMNVPKPRKPSKSRRKPIKAQEAINFGNVKRAKIGNGKKLPPANG